MKHPKELRSALLTLYTFLSEHVLRANGFKLSTNIGALKVDRAFLVDMKEVDKVMRLLRKRGFELFGWTASKSHQQYGTIIVAVVPSHLKKTYWLRLTATEE